VFNPSYLELKFHHNETLAKKTNNIITFTKH